MKSKCLRKLRGKGSWVGCGGRDKKKGVTAKSSCLCTLNFCLKDEANYAKHFINMKHFLTIKLTPFLNYEKLFQLLSFYTKL